MRRLTDIDLRLLRIFCTIVDCNGFRNAQLALNMAQSTLSTHMASLESALGTKLCERGRRGFRLTATGEETHHAALELFRSIEGFQAKMGRVHGRDTERLRLGIIDTVATNTNLDVPAAIARFVNAYPNVTIDLEIMPYDELQRAIIDGRRDVIVGPSKQQSPTITYRTLTVETHHLYCSSAHPWFELDDNDITRAVFHGARFSVRSYHYFDDVYRLGAVGTSAIVSNMEAQEIMLLSGAYVGFLPSHKGAQHSSKGVMRAIKPQEWSMESRFYAAFDDSSGRTTVKRALVKCLADNT
ncbi:MAG: LysR family transcriptional regulator [Granulosicoccus sp.]